jgi:hypothetical protein
MATYRPRWRLQCWVPSLGDRATRRAQEDSEDVIELDLKPVKIELCSNSHNMADTLKVTVPFLDSGIDPRLLSGMHANLWLDNADDQGHFVLSGASLRFVGQMVRATRHMPEDGERMLEIEFHDWTSIFISNKHYPGAEVPFVTSTIVDAWRTVCRATPGAEDLTESFVLKGPLAERNPRMSDAMGPRMKALGGRVPTKPDVDSWATFQACCGMIGLIAFWRRDLLYIVDSESFWTIDDPPVLVWGRNLSNLVEVRNEQLFENGIILTAFDVGTGRTLEGRFPPKGSVVGIKKRLRASKKGGTIPATYKALEYDVFDAPAGVSSQTTLDICCKRAWLERSKQQLQGKATTSEMRIATASDAEFDLLSLSAGDVIRIELDAEDKAMLASMSLGGSSIAAMVGYLRDRGYSRGVSLLMAGNAEDLSSASSIFYVNAVETSIDVDAQTFSIEVAFSNRIIVSTEASADSAHAAKAAQPGHKAAPAKPAAPARAPDNIPTSGGTSRPEPPAHASPPSFQPTLLTNREVLEKSGFISSPGSKIPKF